MESKGYTEYTKGIFEGYFKKVSRKEYPAITKNLKFYYSGNLPIKMSYILSVPFVNKYDNNKIAGIVFVHSNNHVISYIIEEARDVNNPKNISANIFLENSNMKIVNAGQVVGTESIIDWQCLGRCLATSAWKCVPFAANLPLYALCTSTLWAMCYDFCTLSKP